MLVGIESLSFYTSRYFLDLRLLAQARNVDPNKFLEGLGQEKMAVLPPNEDIVTLAASAAKEALYGIDPNSIAMVLSATESGVDQSKACGIWVHHLLNLNKNCRVIELKQACYSGCGALQLALSFLRQYPMKKVLLLTTDVARYGLNTPGEPTQGCGACALVLSAEPKLMAFEAESGIFASHVMDFWRPNYMDEALVDGKYSTKIYLSALTECWQDYHKQSGRSFDQHARFCYHIPFTRMAEKAHERLTKIAGRAEVVPEHLDAELKDSLVYSRALGNSYTASLFIGLSSLLENSKSDLGKQRVGFFSYGSGCVAEFFSGVVLPGYRSFLKKEHHSKMLSERLVLTMDEYEAFYRYRLPEDGSAIKTPEFATGSFVLTGIDQHQRQYSHSM